MDTKFSDYVIHKIANSESGFNYYLYINARGNAIIMRENIAGTDYLYANAGYSDKQWTNRASLTYVTFDMLSK